jgi:16S rRNA (guanine527-N7)-methyltransferase
MDRLVTGIEALGLEYTGEQIQKIKDFITEIELWNPSYKLTAPGEDIVVRHVLDSLTGVPVIKSLKPESLADIGSGAGFPGIPLAIWMDPVPVFLIERSGRRAGFLRNAAVLLGLTNVTVLEKPVEEVIPEQTGQRTGFDVVTFRAWSAIDKKLLDSLRRILAPGGTVAAYKGKRTVIDAEISAVAHLVSICGIRKLTVPGLTDERNMVLLKFN